MLPGFPRLLPRAKASPFSLSGSFDADLDGWTPSAAARSTSNFRTSPACVNFNTNGYIEYTIPKDVAGGQTITLSFYYRSLANGISITVTPSYKIGAGPFVNLAGTGSSSAAYSGPVTRSFDNPGNNDVTIRLTVTSSPAYVDDWVITGTPL